MAKTKYRNWTIVSLGCDCEVDFRFRFYNKTMNSHFYSYASILSPFAFVRSIQNIESPMPEDFEPFKTGMMRSTYDEIGYHLKDNQDWPIERFSMESVAFFSRLHHLREKTKQLFADKESHIIFVQKIPYHWMSQSYFEALLSALDSVVSGEFQIVFITERQYREECFHYMPSDKRTHLESVRHFDVPSKRGDLWRWLKICRKYSSGSTARYLLSASPVLRKMMLPLVLRIKRCWKGEAI